MALRLLAPVILCVACAGSGAPSPPMTEGGPAPGFPGCVTFPPTTGMPVPSPACVTVAELPGFGQLLPAGRYTKSDFSVRLSFTVDDGWTAVESTAGFFDIQHDPTSPDVVALQFANVGKSVADAVAEIKSHEMSRTENVAISVGPSRLMIDGYEGWLLTVDSLDDPNTVPPVVRPVLTVATGPISISSGRAFQVILLDVNGKVLAVLARWSQLKSDHVQELVNPVIRSITIDE